MDFGHPLCVSRLPLQEEERNKHYQQKTLLVGLEVDRLHSCNSNLMGRQSSSYAKYPHQASSLVTYVEICQCDRKYPSLQAKESSPDRHHILYRENTSPNGDHG